jgi:hypothetical protein
MGSQCLDVSAQRLEGLLLRRDLRLLRLELPPLLLDDREKMLEGVSLICKSRCACLRMGLRTQPKKTGLNQARRSHVRKPSQANHVVVALDEDRCGSVQTPADRESRL